MRRRANRRKARKKGPMVNRYSPATYARWAMRRKACGLSANEFMRERDWSWPVTFSTNPLGQLDRHREIVRRRRELYAHLFRLGYSCKCIADSLNVSQHCVRFAKQEACVCGRGVSKWQ